MINGDTILFALLIVTLINLARYFSALRSLLYIMRDAHPLLYQQVDGRGFSRPKEIGRSKCVFTIILKAKNTIIIMMSCLWRSAIGYESSLFSVLRCWLSLRLRRLFCKQLIGKRGLCR